MAVTTGAQDDQFLKRGQTVRKTSNSSDNPKSFIRPFSDNFEAIRNVSQIGHQEFTILKTINSGKFSKIFLARPELGTCKQSLEQALVLKAFHAKNTPTEEFFCEMDLNYFLSPHPNIVTSYNLSFSWNDLHIYPQEYAPFGDISSFIKVPLPEGQVKAVAQQLSKALEFIHSLGLVHRDVMPENVLVFQKDLSLVKLSDFGSMVTTRALLTKSNGLTSTCNEARKGGMALAYLPPEICGILPQEKYHCYPSIDVWQLGILIFACLTGGNCPWKIADEVRDAGFGHYCDWLKRKCIKPPKEFLPFSCRLTRLLKRMLEPKPTKRCRIQEVSKYLKDEWLTLKGSSSLEKISLMNRSNSDGEQIKCKKTNSNVGFRGKSERVKGRGRCDTITSDQKIERKEPVFRIQCSFQCRNQGKN